jgi:CheY-like chemotaxis protein
LVADEKPDSAGEAGRLVTAESYSLLVVDDSEANRDALCRRLRRRGYAVTAANDGTQALALVAQGRFDLILLDIMMPGLNGAI